ncbi:hypothetical protein BDZ97DRAFT_1920689 [Flammula alnicola]|nr:hypothetical protein BDZ97DRAFT_1920689 [Flammula alnicola]
MAPTSKVYTGFLKSPIETDLSDSIWPLSPLQYLAGAWDQAKCILRLLNLLYLHQFQSRHPQHQQQLHLSSPHASISNLYTNLPPSSPPPASPGPEIELENSLDIPENNADSIFDAICNGQLIEWMAGSIWDTYTYQQYNDDQIECTPIGYEGEGYIWLQSKSCKIHLTAMQKLNNRACDACFSLLNSKSLHQFMECAIKDVIPHTPWKFLNARQLKNLLIVLRKKANSLKLESLSANRCISRLQKKLNDYLC